MRGKGRTRLLLACGLAVAGACVFAATALGAAPANDMFAAAQTVTGAQGSVTGTNVGATKEAGEPNHAGNKGGASVWYSWTPSIYGPVTISTFGSSFDTLLAVYTGSSLSSLQQVAANDDAGGGGWSSVTFLAITGTTYRIAVDGWNGQAGNVTLGWNQNPTSPIPANDNFANAQPLTGFCSSTPGTNVAATKEPGEPNHAGNVGGASVWYVWTPVINGQTTMTTAGSDFDTLLGVYTGSSVSSLTQVAANDDVNPPSDTTSSVTFNAVAGTTYHIAVDGYFGPSHGLHEGHIAFNWCETTPPPKCNQVVGVKWHYRLPGQRVSWSTEIGSPDCHTGAVSVPYTPAPMTVNPGQKVEIGYAFRLLFNTSTYVVAQMSPKITFNISCVLGSPSQSTLTVTMPERADSISDGLWHPTADPNAAIGFQGSFVMPALCPNGGAILLNHIVPGGTFTANILLF